MIELIITFLLFIVAGGTGGVYWQRLNTIHVDCPDPYKGERLHAILTDGNEVLCTYIANPMNKKLTYKMGMAKK